MKKLAIAALGAATLLVSCTDNNKAQEVQNKRVDLARTELKANEKIAEVRQDANKDLAKANEQVAEARTDVEKERAKAAEHLNKEVTNQRENVAQARQDLTEAERELAARRADGNSPAIGGAGPGTGATMGNGEVAGAVVSGVLTSTLGKQLTVREANGTEVKLATDAATRVTLNGNAVDLDKAAHGTRVRATWSARGNDKLARNVELLEGETGTHADGHAGTRKGLDPMDVPVKK